MRVRLTEALVAKTIGNGKLTFVRDDRLIGFALQVTPAGTKSFVAEVFTQGRSRRFTIGRADRMTVDEARSKAKPLLGKMSEGHNPQLTRKAGREKSPKLSDQLEEYLDAQEVRPLTREKYSGLLRRNCADWLDKPITDLTAAKVRLRFETIAKRSKSEAAGTMRVLRAVCKRATIVLPERADGSPAMKSIPTVGLPSKWGTTVRKTTRIDPKELPAFWLALSKVESDASRRAIQSLLLTGLRVSELLALTWEDVDADNQQIFVRKSKTDPFTKYIGPTLVKWLKEWRGSKEGNDPVFGVQDLRAAFESIVNRGGKLVTAHDLRRTFLSFAERIGTPLTAMKVLVGHATSDDVTLGYSNLGEDDFRQAAERIERAILNAAEEKAALRLVSS